MYKGRKQELKRCPKKLYCFYESYVVESLDVCKSSIGTCIGNQKTATAQRLHLSSLKENNGTVTACTGNHQEQKYSDNLYCH